MNREDFFREIGNIDAKYIEEADAPLNRGAWKKYTAVAAALIIIASAAVIKSPSAQAAIKKLFSFIPGIAIEETENDGKGTGILYSMDSSPITNSDSDMTVTLENVYVTDSTVNIVYKTKLDFIDEASIKPGMTAEDYKKISADNGLSSIIGVFQADSSLEPSFTVNPNIEIAGNTARWELLSSGGSKTEIMSTIQISDLSDIIGKYGSALPIKAAFDGISFDIKLKPIEYFDKADEIGPTDMHNGISITAMPRWEDGRLYVKFYALNYSEFSQVYGYVDEYDTENTMPYVEIGGQRVSAVQENGDGTEFSFDLPDFGDDEKANAVLHVPVIEVLNNESTVLEFKVNKDGTIDFPSAVSLEYAELSIKSMKLAGSEMDNGIIMEYTSAGKTDSLTLGDFRLDNINGKKNSGVGTWSYTDGNTHHKAFSTDSTDVMKYRSVEISDPVYVVNDEYVFSLN